MLTLNQVDKGIVLMNEMYRQGDVLVSRIELPEIPQQAEALPMDGQRVILAYGEVTGHAHALAGDLASKYQWQGDTLLEVKPGGVLSHEEHTAIPMAPGIYKVTIQREYHPEEIRNVVD